MLTDEKRTEILEAAKEVATDLKPRIAGLHHHLLSLYTQVDDYEKKSNVIGQRVTVVTNDFTSRIAQIARGSTPPTKDLLGDLNEFFTEEEVGKLDTVQPKSMKDYWVTVLEGIEMIAGVIEESDRPALEALKNIEVKIPDGENAEYSLIFHFDANEYFSNETLEVFMTVDKNDEVIEMDSDKIEWKPGKCLTQKEKPAPAPGASKNKKKKKKANAKPESLRSFFHIFRTVTAEEMEQGPEESMDEVMEEYDPMFMGDILSFIKNLVLKYHSPSFFKVEIPDLATPGLQFLPEDMKEGFGSKGKAPNKEDCKKQ